jgi:hypothetical protein
MLRKRFEMEVREELRKVYSLNERELPGLLAGYLESSGLPHDPQNLLIRWADSKIRRGPRWMNVDMTQINTPAPFRSVYIKGRFLGIPLEGLDTYSGGHGEMTIRALKFLKVAEERGAPMDVSALVTLLSEAPFLPSLFLAECTEWSQLDDERVEGRIRDHGITASGLFTFDEHGRFLKFYTEDRYCAEFNMEQHPWSVEVLSYRDTGGFIYPAECTATWHLPEGDLKYFHGRIRDAKFNIRTL